jgi:hypothetical protein
MVWFNPQAQNDALIVPTMPVDRLSTYYAHQGLDQQCPVPLTVVPNDGTVQRRNVLGGIVHDYVRAAA